jgi:hypothetical protein
VKQISILLSTLAAFAATVMLAPAQIAVPPPAPEVQMRSSAELDQILGPIALYPDPLLGQMLPAATLPQQIVMVDRYIQGGGDPNLTADEGWDLSVQALARYPTVLNWMDANLAWTTELGQVFLYQQQDVMDSIQRLRAQAQALGNLQPTAQENVVTDAGSIEILPADPNLIFVPVYQPDVVYFQRPYGAAFVSFSVGFAVGAWLTHGFDWHNHQLVVWSHEHPRPADWWHRPPGDRRRIQESHAVVWQAHNRPQPNTGNMDRGWGTPQVHSTVTVIGNTARPVAQHQAPPPPAARPQPEAPTSRPASGALIGVQSSHETHQYSNRGQQSRKTISTPAPSSGRR